MPHRLSRRALLGAGAFVAGVGRAGADASSPRRGGTLRVSTSLRINTLNPLRHLQTPEYLANDAMQSGLASLNMQMEAEPMLAERWDSNGDATEFIFHMRPGAVFHHGPPVTAEDAAATILAVLDPKRASPAQKNIGPVSSAVALDPQTLKVSLHGPFADLPVSMAHINLRIVPAALLQQDPKLLDTGDYGAGPFKLKSFDSQRGLRVERFEQYWQKDQPYLDAIEAVLYPDINTEATALINGETDLLLVGQPETWDQLSNTAGVVALQTKAGSFYNVVLRTDTPPFNDIRVRQALALAIDRDSLVQLVIEGTGRPAYDDPISPEYRFHIDAPPIKRDVVAAKRLLAEAGHPDGIKITLICPNRPTARTALGVAMREMARPAGFDIEVQTIPYDTYLASYWRKYNFYVSMSNMQATEDAMFTLWLTSDSPWNETQWNNKQFDAAVSEARATLDIDRRRALYRTAQELLVQEKPYLISFYQDLLAARRSYVQGMQLHPRGNRFYMERTWMDESAPKRG